ncbi:MAG: DUF4115 domain-containing protein [Rhodospirillales bacterium]|nr:DUF4115 domain-containing protein [Rhodospirillales bacterium]
MWTLWKQNRNRGRRAGGSATGDNSAGAYAASVGTILRQARQSLGEELRHSAGYLRIREPYLRAIEDGRYEDLPGRAYAVGFVRAYAIHLGLDGDKVVERFKIESGDVEAQQELVIPEPAAESAMPGGSLVAASLVLAVAAYGGWYYLSTHHRLVTEAPGIDLPARPATPPAQVVATNRAATPSPQNATAAPRPAPAPAPIVSSALAPTVTVPPRAEPALPPAASTGFAASLSSGLTNNLPFVGGRPRTSGALPATEVAAAASADADEAENGQVPPVPEPLRPSQSAALMQQSLPAPQGAAAEQVARPPISASSAVAATVDGATARPAGPSRIMVRAIADSWVSIGDGRGTSLFAQVLRAGDSFPVPDRPGLKLDTGNAGGLEITVDGRPVPSVGPSGSVRRNIPLDIEKLVAGHIGQR